MTIKNLIKIVLICVGVICLTIYFVVQHNKQMKTIHKPATKTSKVVEDEVATSEPTEIYISNDDNEIIRHSSLMSEHEFIYAVRDEFIGLRDEELKINILKAMYQVYLELDGKMIPDDYNVLYTFFLVDNCSVKEAARKLKENQEAFGIYP